MFWFDYYVVTFNDSLSNISFVEKFMSWCMG